MATVALYAADNQEVLKAPLNGAAALADGGYVLGSADANGVRLRLFGSLGDQRGDDVILDWSSSSSGVSVQTLSSGRLAATWVDSNRGLFARIVNADGSGVTETVAISPSAAATAPTVASLAGDRFVAVWQEAGGTNFKGQVLTAAGAEVGSEFLIDLTGLNGSRPLVTGFGDGSFVIAGPGGVAQAYDASGAKMGAEFRVNDGNTSGMFAVTRVLKTLTALPDGGFIAVSENSVTNGNVNSTDPANLTFKIFDRNGNARGSTFGVETDSSGSQSNPSVAATSDGFAVTWDSGEGFFGRAPGSGYGILGQLFDLSGNRIGGKFLVNDGPRESVYISQDGLPKGSNRSLLTLADGDLLAGWTLEGVSVGKRIGVADSSELIPSSNGVYDARGASGVMLGTTMNDTYYVDGADDVVAEAFSARPPHYRYEPVQQAGFDTVITSVDFALRGGSAVERLTTDAPNARTDLHLTGNEFNQEIVGNDGRNFLIGGGGADMLIGRGGDDSYGVDQVGDRVLEEANGGFDTVYASGDHQLATGSSIEILAAGDFAATSTLRLAGNELAQTIYGNAGANELVGGGGADTLIGFAGDDSYTVDSLDDMVVETANGGYDTLYTTISYTLPSRLSVEVLSTISWIATTAIDLSGNEASNVIFGNDGANRIDGGAGADRMVGFGGNDIYFVGDAGDLVVERAGGGTDTIVTSASHRLSEGSEVEVLATNSNIALDPINLRGNGFAQTIYGNAGANFLIGDGGADTLIGYAGDDSYGVDTQGDVIVEEAGSGYDTVYASASYRLGAGISVEVLAAGDFAAATAVDLRGNEFGQIIYGNAGTNFLIGDGGADRLVGFGGDDSYGVDDPADIVVEGANGGYDTVYASTSYRLAEDMSVEVLATGNFAATAAIDLRGNDGPQTIFGNVGANFLIGGGGADRLVGFSGDDNYGVDQMGDIVVERAGEGYDTVYASGSYALAAGVSVEVLSAGDFARTDALQLLGNEFGQLLYGNAGANVLVGGGGADTLFGLSGDDSYGVDQAADVVMEAAGEGYDSVYASTDYRLSDAAAVEVLSASDWWGSDPLALTGNRLGNAVFGNAGANTLDGGSGVDALTGFAGADRFLFSTAPGDDNVDRVTDFEAGTDKVVLDGAVFANLPAGMLDETAFHRGPAAADASDRIIYDPNNGSLFYDADGVGGAAAVRFAVLQTGLVLNSADFVVI